MRLPTKSTGSWMNKARNSWINVRFYVGLLTLLFRYLCCFVQVQRFDPIAGGFMSPKPIKTNVANKQLNHSECLVWYNQKLFFFFAETFRSFLLRHFGHWNISVICLTVVLKLAVTVFFSVAIGKPTSGKRAKLHTVAASNNRVDMSRSLHYFLDLGM